MVRNLFLVLLLICLQKCSHGKHLLRFLTFCQRDVPEDGQYDIEYDGDQLLYVDPLTFQAVPRLPEFAEQWTPDPKLAKDAFVSLGTCKYNIPRAIKGENRPPVVIVSPTSLIIPKQDVELGVPNTLICFVNDFHPPVVDITWTRNGHLVDQSEVSQTQYYSNSDFSFRTTSYLRFTPQENDIYSCSVDHASLQAPLTRFWEVEVHTDHQTAETSVCVCGVILGLIGVVTGLWFIMKANKSCWA
ncbi:H-2 class II histocompatibility antigen, A-U alpha chain-like isoform X1 [Toxotes jaculatrix]|uniref:H-2 class II histocompatibility antigen, A-U alpha chain-like isoform X1 n=1 Tax=Toxotes jaculatrix TaxID=941984 RepID=UPI001B3A95CC|nr:H-2 class II histocompatibility antigen, A-U alpha chain-like isoform X1 [Toxotes jaculatrix]